MTVANFFDEIAAAQTPAPVRRKLEAAEKRAVAKKAFEQEAKDNETLTKLYRAWKAEKRSALLTGPFGKEVRGIVSFLDSMTLESAPTLLKVVDRSAWIVRMPVTDRAELLSLIGTGIRRCREKAGLCPFDDAVPFLEEPKAFHVIKTAIGMDGR